MAENKLRILCLHGYRQNKNVFREKLGQFRKNLKNHAEFHFIDAPHEVKDSFGANQSDERSWWFTSEDNTYQSKIKTDFCIGLEDSIALVQKTFANEGPFDGILGFSQGAAFTAIICGLLTKKALDFELKFVMIVAGFKSLYDGHAELYEQQINIASLHVIGGGDEVISQGGDINSDFDSNRDKLSCFEFKNLLRQFNMTFTNTENTRDNACLDNLLTNVRSTAVSTRVLPFPYSDHKFLTIDYIKGVKN
ncbi:esterase OVCA2 isoform X2 [Nilaparvata lugens]|uniref:esterase OVCA2 isoform X2 n=1 Tax=Nilaparvata lugens TaxID=108931 RepID=UPI00193D80EC|nr:esterase OVCA2 isoform X2 [Nilaparvata lugens]